MLEVCLLGTGGMQPMPRRWLTSLMVRYNGSCVLIDCGEGTQIAMREKGWSPKPIDVMCFTHYHADHISGLPGMFLTMGKAERTEPVLLIGPKGLTRVVNALKTIAPELPFSLEFLELSEPEQTIQAHGLRIEAFRVNHSTPCYGYSIVVDRIGRFQVDRAIELEIEQRYWNRLQKGETITLPDRVLTPDMVLGAQRKGLKVTYTTDTRPCESIVRNAANADLFICEGMYGEPEKFEKAREYKHMMFTEAAQLAQKAEVGEMWLTHYSPSLVRPEAYMESVRSIFPNAHAAKDGRSIDLLFEED